MNSLSWMIYLADVADSLQTKVGIIAIALLVAFLVKAFASTFEDGEPWEKPATWRLRWAIAGLILLAINAVIPSQTTIYAIAASETGETALNTETGGKAVQALNAWLDRQIAGEATKK